MVRKGGIPAASAAARSVLMPILPKLKKDEDDTECSEHRKKKTLTNWRLRQQKLWNCCLVLLVLVVLALTSRGYHRRSQDRLQDSRRKEWLLFRRKNIGSFLKRGAAKGRGFISNSANRDAFLKENPHVKKQWQNHLEQKGKSDLLNQVEDDHPEKWAPQNSLDQASDLLASGAEYLGNLIHANAKPVLGPSLTDEIGSNIHAAVNAAGDSAEDITVAFSKAAEEWGQTLFDMLGATTDSVYDWMMEGFNSTNTSLSDVWANWTSGFLRTPSSWWNYTAEQEELDDSKFQEEEAKESENQAGEMSIAAKIGMMKPRPLPEKTQLKFAFVTTEFPMPSPSQRFETYVLPALKTWLNESVLFYVASNSARSRLSQQCAKEENEEACQRLYPIYVNCPSADYAVFSCCQQDKGMGKISYHYPSFEWYVYFQDSIYFRLDFLKDFTADLPNPKLKPFLLSSSPFRPHGAAIRELNLTTPTKTNCSATPNHMYPWGRPAVIYSNAALKTVAPAYARLAISRECNAFHVQAGGGSSIVHWMFQLPVLRMPMISSRTPKNLAEYLMPPPEPNEGQLPRRKGYNAFHRFIGYNVDGDTVNFTDVHEAYIAAKKRAEGSEEAFLYPRPPYPYIYHRPNGYMETELFKDKGFPQNWTRWHTFEPHDCIQFDLTQGLNMLVNGTWMKRTPLILQQIKRAQDEMIQQADPVARQDIQKKLADRTKRQGEVLNKLDLSKKQELLQKLEELKKQLREFEENTPAERKKPKVAQDETSKKDNPEEAEARKLEDKESDSNARKSLREERKNLRSRSGQDEAIQEPEIVEKKPTNEEGETSQKSKIVEKKPTNEEDETSQKSKIVEKKPADAENPEEDEESEDTPRKVKDDEESDSTMRKKNRREERKMRRRKAREGMKRKDRKMRGKVKDAEESVRKRRKRRNKKKTNDDEE